MILGSIGILNSKTGIPTSSLLLDLYPNATAAYSLRQLSSTYTGSAIRVRRSSDNAEQDFGFVSNVLDTASLLTFCGAGNGFVTTWYDQSGNANNASVSTAVSQPQIVSSGALLTVNSKTCISFDGLFSTLNLASTITVGASNYNSFVGKRDVSGRKLYGLSGGTSLASGYLWGLWSDNKYYLQCKATQYQASSAADTTTSQLLLTGLNNAGTMSMFKNGNTITSSAVNFTLSMNINSISGNPTPSLQPSFGNLQEIVFYNSEQSANRTGIETNINTFYTIY